MALINCPECNKEISDKVKACLHCGYPIVTDDVDGNRVQPVEITSVKINEMSVKVLKKRLLIIGITCSIIIIFLVGLFVLNLINNNKKRQSYIENLSLMKTTSLIGANDSESLCGITYKVWRNTIYKESDSETDKYTRVKGGVLDKYEYYGYHSDFNISLENLYADEETQKTIENIKNNQNLVQSIMNNLKKIPSKEFESVYSTVNDLYGSYQALTAFAINPNGNLSNYSKSYGDKIDKFLECYKKLETQIPDK